MTIDGWPDETLLAERRLPGRLFVCRLTRALLLHGQVEWAADQPVAFLARRIGLPDRIRARGCVG
jgi:hypothetical protein